MELIDSKIYCKNYLEIAQISKKMVWYVVWYGMVGSQTDTIFPAIYFG